MRTAAKILAVMVSSLVVAGCTTALQPVTPEDDASATAVNESAQSSGQQANSDSETTDLTSLGLTPAEAGLIRTWSVNITAAPKQITVSERGEFVVVLLEGELITFRLIAETALLEQWRFQIEQGDAENLIIGNDQVYFNISGEHPDLVAFDLRSGEQRFSWRRMHSLDSEVPQIVGFYPRGLGVVKQGRNSFTAAILDSHGESVADRTLYHQTENVANLAPTFLKGIVDSGIVENGLQQFIYFPSLQVIPATNCFELSQGAVCTRLFNLLSSADSSTFVEGDEASKTAGVFGEVVEYDQFGQPQKVHDIPATAEVLQRNFIAGLPELTTTQLAAALVAEVEVSGVSERVPSYLYGADWFSIAEKSASLTNSDSQTCTLIPSTAPLCITDAQVPQIISLQDGRVLNSPDSVAVLGVQNNRFTFFEYANGKLWGLIPKTSAEASS